MANRTTHLLKTPKDQIELITGCFDGNTTDQPTLPEEDFLGGGELASVTRTDTGDFSIVFRHKYPQLKCPFDPVIVGTTAGLKGRWVAIDLAAGTATITLEVGAVSTDPATTDRIYLALMARNSGVNT